jgi:hypothetical protein
MRTFGLPGIQGVVTGTHGAGVGTPKAAEVAAITAGLVGAVHIPNGGILATGAKSIIVAAGFPPINTVGRMTFRVAGATPKEHIISAPITTY